MNLTIRSTISRYLPPWLQARRATGKVRAFKFIYCSALMCDFLEEFTYQGQLAALPGSGTSTALPLIGRDRRIRRGIGETDLSYAARLRKWYDYWRGAGNAFAIMQQARDFLGSTPKMRIVNSSGTWYTLNPDDTIEIVQTWGAVNWNWDNTAPAFSGAPDTGSTDFWLIVYSNAGPWTVGGSWDGGLWDDGRTFGTSATAEQGALLRAIVQDFKCGGDRCRNIIIAFDPTSFDPHAAPNAAGMPDGTWGHWSKIVGGVQVPARLTTAEYFDGV